MDPVADRHKSVSEVLCSVRRFERSTARLLGELLAPELEDGRPLPDFVYLQRLLAAALDRCWRRLLDADEACHDARAHRRGLIDERDEGVRELYREVVDLRILLRGRFGAEPSKRFIGVRGATSRDPVVLLRQGDRAVARLRALDRPLPPSRFRLSAALRARWARPLAAAAAVLRALVDRVVTAAKRVDAARLHRRRALEDFNGAFVLIAGWFEATYRLTGRDDRADGVRPSRQYPGLTFEQGKARRRRVKSKAAVVRFPRLEPVLRLFGSREKSL